MGQDITEIGTGGHVRERRPRLGIAAFTGRSILDGSTGRILPPAARAIWSRSHGGPAVAMGIGSAVVIATRAGTHGYRSVTLEPALETVTAFFALGAAWLLRDEYLRSRRRADLLWLAGLVMLGLLSVLVDGMSTALGVGARATAIWMGGLLSVGAVFLAAARAAPTRLVRAAHPPAVSTIVITVGTLAVAGVAGWMLEPAIDGAAAQHPWETGERLVLGAGPALLLVAGAVALLRSGRRRDGWTGLAEPAALLILAGSCLYVGSSHPAAADQLTSETMLTTIAALALFIAPWHRRADARARTENVAALDERRRLAHSLHDGLAQDLAFIVAHGSTFPGHADGEHPVVLAAKRALATSRSTILALSDWAGFEVHESLEAIAGEFRERFGVAIAVATMLDEGLGTETQRHIVRIGQLVMADAIHTRRARHIIVSLSRLERAVVFRIVDDGSGRLGAEARESHGVMAGLRHHADAMGGYLSVHELRSSGREVEVIFR